MAGGHLEGWSAKLLLGSPPEGGAEQFSEGAQSRALLCGRDLNRLLGTTKGMLVAWNVQRWSPSPGSAVRLIAREEGPVQAEVIPFSSLNKNVVVCLNLAPQAQ